jgi:hypothetical protein
MDLCSLKQAREIVRHRQMKAAPEPFLKAIAPYQEGLVVGVEGLFTWSWLADLGAREGMPFVLGHARSMTALPGGNAKHDRIEAQKIAGLLRGGLLPPADVSPAARRATRALLRRRIHVRRPRAEFLTHVPPTNSQDNLPALGKKLADKANRGGVSARFPDPAGPKHIAVDLALLGHDAQLRRDVERSIRTTAKPHNATTLYRRRTVPGIGEILSVGRRYDIHDLQRFPCVQDGVSSGRLVTCAQAAAGTRSGTSGSKMGHASLTGAVSDAAGLF